MRAATLAMMAAFGQSATALCDSGINFLHFSRDVLDGAEVPEIFLIQRRHTKGKREGRRLPLHREAKLASRQMVGGTTPCVAFPWRPIDPSVRQPAGASGWQATSAEKWLTESITKAAGGVPASALQNQLPLDTKICGAKSIG